MKFDKCFELLTWSALRHLCQNSVDDVRDGTLPLTEFVTESFHDVLARCVTNMPRHVWQNSVTEFVDESLWHKRRSPCMSKVRDGVRDGIIFDDTFGMDGVPYDRWVLATGIQRKVFERRWSPRLVFLLFLGIYILYFFLLFFFLSFKTW